MKKVFTYINQNNLVVYSSYEDSFVNRNNYQLRRYVISPEYYGLFVRYYQLRLHKNALKNIIY